MSDVVDDDYKRAPTQAAVEVYKSSSEIFEGLLKEVRELSRKKPEATMSVGKVKLINRVLEDLLSFLKEEPEAKYLDVLDDTALPQVSDAVLIMVQFETALASFKNRHFRYSRMLNTSRWVTKEHLDEMNEDDDEDEE